jgi:ABC-type sugar transport system permease subunit
MNTKYIFIGLGIMIVIGVGIALVMNESMAKKKINRVIIIEKG